RLLETYVRQGEQDSRPGAAPAPQEASPAQPEAEPASSPTGQQIAAALSDGAVREPLTARESEVLFAVAQGLSNAEIAGQFFLSEATAKTHVRRILTKLQLRDRVQAVVYVYQSGLGR